MSSGACCLWLSRELSRQESSMEALIRKDESALSGVPQRWGAINWRRIERNVRAMQIRIAKATQEGDWRRVKALQRSLTCSFSAKASAVKRVTENQGKRTAGVDRELWDSPEARWEAIGRLKRRGIGPCHYGGLHPQSQREGAPSGHSDHVGPSHAGAVSAGAGTGVRRTSDPNSYGFRINRSTADAMSQLFLNLSKRPRPAGFWKRTSGVASTTSVTTGWNTMSPWTRWSFGSG